MDIAFNSYLCPYDTGRTDRIPELVIQVRETYPHEDAGISPNTKFAEERIAADRSGAGESWSHQELDVSGIGGPRALVIGELLPSTTLSDIMAIHPAQRPSSPTEFNPAQHPFIRQNVTRHIVVARVIDKTQDIRSLRLFVLFSKKDGLCRMLRLPGAKNAHLEDRIFFYSEWTRNPGPFASNYHGHYLHHRFSAWRRDIYNFMCRLPQSGNTLNSLSWHKRLEVGSRIPIPIHLTKPTKKTNLLPAPAPVPAKTATNGQAIDCQPEEERLLERLLCGKEEYHVAEAREAADTFQGNWFNGTDMEFRIQPVHLMELGLGLRAEVLGHPFLPAREVWKSFVINFCILSDANPTLVDSSLEVSESVVLPDPGNLDPLLTCILMAHKLARINQAILSPAFTTPKIQPPTHPVIKAEAFDGEPRGIDEQSQGLDETPQSVGENTELPTEGDITVIEALIKAVEKEVKGMKEKSARGAAIVINASELHHFRRLDERLQKTSGVHRRMGIRRKMCRQVHKTQWGWLGEETLDRLRDEQIALQTKFLGALADDNQDMEAQGEDVMIKRKYGMDIDGW